MTPQSICSSTMDNKCQTLEQPLFQVFVLYLVLALLLVHVLCVSSDSDRNQLSGPNGEECIQRSDNHHSSYDHTDENGLHCLCQLCRPGNVLKKNCTCDPNNLDRPQESECGIVSIGQFMNSSNLCSRGFDCKKCPHPLKVKDSCSPHGPDTVCTCVVGYYMTSRDTCLPIPKCDAEYEPASGHGDHGSEFRCTPCHEGYFQPNKNSTLKCKKIRQCTKQEGTRRSDAVCLNDPTPLPTKQPTNGYVTTETSTTIKNYKPVTTPVLTPRGNEIINASGSTTSPTPNDTDELYNRLCVPVWICVIIFIVVVPFSFLFGIVLGYNKLCCLNIFTHLCSYQMRRIWNYFHSFYERVSIEVDGRV